MVVVSSAMVKHVCLPSPLSCRRRSFLLESLRATSNETIQHGACLGLGLAGLGTCDEELFEDLKGVLYTDSAVRQLSATRRKHFRGAYSCSDSASVVGENCTH